MSGWEIAAQNNAEICVTRADHHMRAQLGSKPQLYNDLGQVVNTLFRMRQKLFDFCYTHLKHRLSVANFTEFRHLTAGQIHGDGVNPLFGIRDADHHSVVLMTGEVDLQHLLAPSPGNNCVVALPLICAGHNKPR